MLIEKFKEKLKELTEESLRFNLIKAFLNKQLEEFAEKELESFVKAMIATRCTDDFKGIDESYAFNSYGYEFEINLKFKQNLGFKK